MNVRLKSIVMVMVLVTMIISCSKEEGVVSGSVQKTESNPESYHYAVNRPYDEGEPGIEPTTPLIPSVGTDTLITDPKYPYTVIETPTQAYKDETCLLDISKLEEHKTYYKVQNDKLTIGFDNQPALKLKSGPTGWNARWGLAPYVECENPEVLFVRPLSSIVTVISFSKPCIEFGFEMAPNHQDYDHGLGVVFGTDFLDYSEGFTSSIVRSPSGARLFAIKATKPFTHITILLNDSPTGDIPINGVGIANIRYRLAK